MQGDSSVAQKNICRWHEWHDFFSQWLELWVLLDAFSKDFRMQIIYKLYSSNAAAHVYYEVVIQ